MLRQKWWAPFRACNRGNVAVLFALSSMAVVSSVTTGVDYARMEGHRASLQRAADAAAIAAAREIPIAHSQPEIIESVAKTFVESNLESMSGIGVSTHMVPRHNSVRVDLNWDYESLFPNLLPENVTEVNVSATARLVGTGAICMIGLDEEEEETIHLKKNASLEAPGCAVYSNSDDKESFKVEDNASVITAMTCTSGGIDGKKNSSFEPEPVTDCPPAPDPLANRAPPTFGGCDHYDLEVKDQVRTLSPGVYCQGLEVRGNAKVKLLPGIYVIKDAKLEVTGEAEFIGENVGFFLTGDDAKIYFKKQTTISLTAPKAGPMAGLLVYEDRSAPDIVKHEITSDNARMLLGTIYLPNGTLRIDSDAPVSDKSAFTAIIARAIELDEGPTLYLNSDYDATDIPLPEGLLGGMVYLSE
ncbi:MAG: pilus assembly protein TadG-related protein [Pseudomonadota bacterium]